MPPDNLGIDMFYVGLSIDSLSANDELFAGFSAIEKLFTYT